jgi:hypothetical protein
MKTEYKVVPLLKLMTWPNDWTGYPQYDEEFSRNMADALNREAAKGWELVNTYSYHQHTGPGYAIFRRGV